MTKFKWEAVVKGSAGERSFEISVVRSDNYHGKQSYGWFDDRKLLISSSGGPCENSVTQFVWDGLVKLANETAARMNSEIDV